MTTPSANSRRLPYAVAAVALTVIAAAAVVVATRVEPESLAGAVDPATLPVGEPVPALDVEGWLNSPPLATADLRGKVVVYDFWTYSCVNCVRTIPYLQAWWDRYRDDGLVIVGVHSPEFDFERDHGNVAGAVDRLGVDWPVALDDHHATFDAFENHWWPAKYVADRDGRLRYTHIGEGRYDETEDVLRRLLGVAASAPRAADPTVRDAAPGDDEYVTPETYLGTFRGRADAVLGVHDYDEPGDLGIDEVALVGRWEANHERVTARQAGAAIVFRYSAAEVNLVLASDGDRPVEVEVEVDGERRDTVTVTAPDLYRIALDDSVAARELRLTFTEPGVSAFAFTFGA